MGAIFAKIISTANNWLFSPSTNLVNDIYVRYINPQASNTKTLAVSRLMVVLLGLWALYQSLAYRVGAEEVALRLYDLSRCSDAGHSCHFLLEASHGSGCRGKYRGGHLRYGLLGYGFIHSHLPAAIGERDAILPALLASLLCLIRSAY